jgi:hypothetical protein
VSEEVLEERCIGDRDMVATQNYDVKAECDPWVVQVIFMMCAWVMFFNGLSRSHIMKTKL